MKKLFSGLLALVLTVTLAAGCAQQEPPSGIFYDVTGIDPRSVAYTAGDVEFPTELYLYWVSYGCSSMEYNLSMYNAYYGLYEEMFDEDGNVLWDADFMDGGTLAEQVREQAESNIRFYAAMESKAKELGVELTEEDLAELEASFADTIEQMGGEEEFQNRLKLMGISMESFDRISEDTRLFEKLLDLVSEEGSALYMSPEDYEKDVSYTDHILLGTTNQETSEPLSEEEAAQKLATAQDLLSQLQNADDKEALFDQLAAEYGEDPGRAAAKGYMVTEDSSFVPEFLEAALALKPGEISDIVESTYGYHILYRRNLSDVMEEFPEQFSSLAEDYLYELLEADAEAMDVTVSEQVSALDIAEFYTAYNAKVEEIQAENDASADTGDGTDDGAGADAGDGADDSAAADDSGADE